MPRIENSQPTVEIHPDHYAVRSAQKKANAGILVAVITAMGLIVSTYLEHRAPKSEVEPPPPSKPSASKVIDLDDVTPPSEKVAEVGELSYWNLEIDPINIQSTSTERVSFKGGSHSEVRDSVVIDRDGHYLVILALRTVLSETSPYFTCGVRADRIGGSGDNLFQSSSFDVSCDGIRVAKLRQGDMLSAFAGHAGSGVKEVRGKFQIARLSER